MLIKQIIGYLPSLLIPAVTSFAGIYFYTRLLTPQEYGYYTLALNSMTLLGAVFFYWLINSVPRLMPQAIVQGTTQEFRATAATTFMGLSCLIVLTALLFGFIATGTLAHFAWLIVPLTIMRSLINMHMAFHRSTLDFKRYNWVECAQAVIGLAIGLLLVTLFHMGATGVLLGMLCGITFAALLDIRSFTFSSLRIFNPVMFREIMHFGIPLVIMYGFSFIISTSDRFLIEYFYDASTVGMYAAGYTLIDRITAALFVVMAAPSFSLTVHMLEQQDREAARRQTYENATAILALAIPVCAGLIIVNHQLAAVMIGSEFRATATQIIPWIAVAAFMNGMTIHYFDHAFHYARKSYLLLFTWGPAAAFNLLLNLLLIPKLGYMGAIYTTVASYALVLTLSIMLGHKVFPVHFPIKPALRIAACTAVMSTVLYSIRFNETFLGLAEMAALGGFIYASAILSFNIMHCRARLRAFSQSLYKSRNVN